MCVRVSFISFRLKMITTKNNSNVGNLISGAVNLHMHTMRSEQTVKWTTVTGERENWKKRQIVNQN